MNKKTSFVVFGFTLLLILSYTNAQISNDPGPSLSNAEQSTGITDSMAETIPAKNCTRGNLSINIQEDADFMEQTRAQSRYNFTKKYCRDNQLLEEQGYNVTYNRALCLTASFSTMPSVTASSPDSREVELYNNITRCIEESPPPSFDTGIGGIV